MGYLVRHSKTGYHKAIMASQRRINHNYSHYDKITDVLNSESWKRSRCFIIGGGDSLRRFNFSILAGEKVIGINRAYEFYPDIDIWYAMDTSYYDSLQDGRMDKFVGDSVYKKWQELKGIKIFLSPINPHVFADKVYFVRRLVDEEVSLDLQKGIFGGNNSGLGALMLAAALGANPIYLLGYDLGITTNSHWHSGYPNTKKEKLEQKLKSYIEQFEKVAYKFTELGIEINNLNLNSALTTFAFKNIEDVITKKRGE